MATEEELENWFGYHRATAESAPLHNQVRTAFFEHADYMNDLLPEGRDKSLVMTKLQEAMHWANSAIAMTNDVDSQTADLPNT